MTTVTMYHNPRCSKSRQTLELLEANGVDLNVVLYLEQPPSKEELQDILKKLDLSPRQLARTKESVYKELALNDADDDALLDAMLQNPILIERPIVVTNNQAAIGRPPENVLEILD